MAKGKMNGLDWTALVLVLIGAINWGLVGFFNFNLVSAIVGNGMIARIIYGLVGVAGIYSIIRLFVRLFAKK